MRSIIKYAQTQKLSFFETDYAFSKTCRQVETLRENQLEIDENARLFGLNVNSGFKKLACNLNFIDSFKITKRVLRRLNFKMKLQKVVIRIFVR